MSFSRTIIARVANRIRVATAADDDRVVIAVFTGLQDPQDRQGLSAPHTAPPGP